MPPDAVVRESPHANRRNGHSFTPETAKRARAKMEARRSARKSARELAPILGYESQYPVITQASRELLPRILADEIAWRSQIMATNNFLLSVYLAALRGKKYDPSKTTLTALGKEIRESLQFQVALVNSTKDIMTPDGSQRQVAGLFARYELLRGELQRLGLMNPDGSLRLPTTEEEAPQDACQTSEESEQDAQASVPEPAGGRVS